MSSTEALMAPLAGAQHRELNGVQLDIVQTGASRVKRVIYQPGFRWSTHLKPTIGGDYCMHTHVGFLAKGRIHVEYQDGVVREFAAPAVVAIDPGHDGWVDGDEPAVFIEFDFEKDTCSRLGVCDASRVQT